MPNDAISREDAIAAVEDKFDLYGELTSYTQVTDAIASLPADTRWEELLKYIEKIGAGTVSEGYFNATEDILAKMAELSGISWEQLLDRLAPAPAEAQKLAPEETKAVLRQALSGCGPMAIVYAEAAINSMAGIESPREPAEAQD